MKTLILFLALCCAAFGQVNHYYVSPSGSGSACSQGSPCAITQVNSVIALGAGSGSTVETCDQTYLMWKGSPNVAVCVHVLPGTYNLTRNQSEFSCLDTTVTGSSGKRIVYHSSGPYQANIVCSSGGSSSGQIWMSSGAYTDIVGIGMSAPSSNICFGLNLNDSNERAISNKVHDVTAPLAFCGNGSGGGGIVTCCSGNQMLGNLIDSLGYANGACNFVHGIYPGGTATETIIENNIISHACGWGIHIFHTVTHEVIANNTVIGNLRGGILLDHDSSGVLNNTTAINNIVIGNGSDSSQKNGFELVSIGSSNLLSHNLLGQNKPLNIHVTSTAPQFSGNICDVSGTGCASTSALTGSGLFVNYTGNSITGDYHLKSGSLGIAAGSVGPCASGGISPCTPTLDFDGNTRSQVAAFDAGALRFASSTVTKPNPPTGLTAIVH